MTTTVHTPAATRPPIGPDAPDLPGRRHPLPDHLRVDPHARPVPARCGSSADFVLGVGSDTGVLWGALSEVVVALAGIGTAVVLFPVAKRQSETAALGFVTTRILEAALILVGVVSVLTVVTLRHDVAGTAGADPASLVTTGHTLARHLRLDLPALAEPHAGLQRAVPGLRDVPVRPRAAHPADHGTRRRPAAARLRHRDLLRRSSTGSAPIAALAALPIAVWEFSLGVYLTVKGFKPAPSPP